MSCASLPRLSLFLLAAWLPFPANSLVDSASPSCRLAVKPTQLTTHDTVTITYLLTGLPFQLSAGSVRFQEEVLGRSLRIYDGRRRGLRLRNIPIHMLGQYRPDTVRAGRLEYRLTFPNPLLRLVDSAEAEHTISREADTLGMRAWAPGIYSLSATLVLKAVPANPTSALSFEPAPLDTIRVVCRPVQLEVR